MSNTMKILTLCLCAVMTLASCLPASNSTQPDTPSVGSGVAQMALN